MTESDETYKHTYKYGEKVIYKNQVYYYQPNGSSCYLYEHKRDIGNKERSKYKPSINSISPYKEDDKDILDITDQLNDMLQLSTIIAELDKKVERKIGWVYVGINVYGFKKDVNIGKSIEVKIGQTIDLKDRRREFKTSTPGFEYIILVKTVEYKELEILLHKEFKQFNLEGEWFDLKLSVIRKKLRDLKYVENENCIFVKQNT